MPVHLLPDAARGRDRGLTRRDFLAGLAAGAAAAACASAGRTPRRGTVWALVSDTHIHESEATRNLNSNMADNLRAVVAGIAAERPDAVMIDGDLALARGNPGDYRTFLALLEPIRRAGIPVHLTLGNHDDRGNLIAAAGEAGAPAVEGKRVSAFADGGVQWLFLDSLVKVNDIPGELGEAQRAWIAARLDAAPETPAVLCVHHNPEPGGGGLRDTAALFEVLKPRRQAKAVFFGHTHVFRRWETDGIHCFNLPAVGYVFTKNPHEQPRGWVRAAFRDGGVDMELRCIDPLYARQGFRESLAWRA